MIRRRPSVVARHPSVSPTSDRATRATPMVDVTRWIPAGGWPGTAGQRQHVAEGGDEGGGHVVEVPPEPDRPGRQPQRRRQHDDRGEQPAEDRHGRQGQQVDRVLQPDDQGDGLGHDGQGQRHDHREQHRPQDVLPEHGLRRSDHRYVPVWIAVRQPVAERAEDVAPQADGRRHEDEQARVLLERVGEGTEEGPATRLVDELSASCDEALADTGHVRPEQGAQSRHERQVPTHLHWCALAEVPRGGPCPGDGARVGGVTVGRHRGRWAAPFGTSSASLQHSAPWRLTRGGATARRPATGGRARRLAGPRGGVVLGAGVWAVVWPGCRGGHGGRGGCGHGAGRLRRRRAHPHRAPTRRRPRPRRRRAPGPRPASPGSTAASCR